MSAAALLPCDGAGSGRTIVLIHAGIADRRMWSEHLQALADEGFRAVAFDLAGFGEAPVNIEQDAPWFDVIASVEHAGIARATVVGVSWGGAVAQRVAVAAPQLVSALVLVSSIAPGIEPSAELRAAGAAEEAAMEAEDVDRAVEGSMDAWLRAGPTPELRRRVAEMQRRALEVQYSVEEPPPGTDPLSADGAELEAIAVPALIAVGEHDMSDFLDSAKVLAEMIPGAELSVIAGAGHLAPLERPQEFRDLLVSFLQAHPHV
ncbi:MAG TPA: alpha/beta fold hydrolase [Solirubrobacteraceae bacterium]|jgi:pimeloyl-ACP methyl ester carboxylesterase|nr:alpha/beta fold hydrolase [Solirubrobacteraceae bacterium]